MQPDLWETKNVDLGQFEWLMNECLYFWSDFVYVYEITQNNKKKVLKSIKTKKTAILRSD